MTDLEVYAAHCRRMVTAAHRPDCTGKSCPGCVTREDRERWALLATEAEAYLAAPAAEPTLL